MLFLNTMKELEIFGFPFLFPIKELENFWLFDDFGRNYTVVQVIKKMVIFLNFDKSKRLFLFSNKTLPHYPHTQLSNVTWDSYKVISARNSHSEMWKSCSQKLCKIHMKNTRNIPPEVFLGKGVLKMYSKFTGEYLCRSVISIKLLCRAASLQRTSGE